MKVLTIATIKGGTGKTTTAAALAQAATKQGIKTLLIDLDPQANLSTMLQADPEKPGSYSILAGEMDPFGAIQRTEQGIDIMAGSSDLAAVVTERGSARRLADGLKPLNRHYKLAIIDTAPHIGELTYNALTASQGLLCPLEADTASIHGFYYVMDIVGHITQATGINLAYKAAIITRYDGRPKLHQYLKDSIHEAAEQCHVKIAGTVRAGIAIQESQALHKSLYDYAPKSKPAGDYLEVFENIRKDLKV